MSTNKLSHLKEGEKIYFPIERKLNNQDDEISLCFQSELGEQYWFNNNDTFYTLEDLRQLTNDGMPKQGEMIDVRHNDGDYISGQKFVCLYEGRVIIERAGGLYRYDEWRFPPKKIQKTLAELEKELGYDEGTLEITN